MQLHIPVHPNSVQLGNATTTTTTKRRPFTRGKKHGADVEAAVAVAVLQEEQGGPQTRGSLVGGREPGGPVFAQLKRGPGEDDPLTQKHSSFFGHKIQDGDQHLYGCIISCHR